MKLTIVVILEYPASRSGCPFQQLQASIHGHDDARRKLVRRGDKCQPRPALRQLTYDQAVLICPSADHPGAMGEQAMQRKLVVRIFNDHTMTRIQEHALDDGERLLCTSDDQNVRGIAGDSAAPS